MTNLTVNVNTYATWNQGEFTLQNIIIKTVIKKKKPTQALATCHSFAKRFTWTNLFNPHNTPILVTPTLQVREWKYREVSFLFQGPVVIQRTWNWALWVPSTCSHPAACHSTWPCWESPWFLNVLSPVPEELQSKNQDQYSSAHGRCPQEKNQINEDPGP